MTNHHIHAALARERANKLLAEAATARRARQARSHRQRADARVARRSPLRGFPDWLRPGWSRLLGHQPQSAVKGRPAVPSRRSA
jgi:hypothetical protein